MVLTTIQQKIKSVAMKFTGAEYFYGDWAQVDVLLDKIGCHNSPFDKPVICHILPASGTLRPKYGATSFIDKPETMIAFLVPSELDFDGEENEDKVELMKHLASLFVCALNESGYFEPIDDVEIPYSVPYDTADDNVTGVVITLSLEEKSGRKYCDIDNIENNFGYTN